MSYNANGKTYTDHPLMDEICYNCKRILEGIVIKNDVLAISKETENSLTNTELYIIQHDEGFISFDVYPFDYNVLYAYYGDSQIAARYEKDKYLIPTEDRDDLTTFANEWFSENFVEENDYYRMLMGLPPFDGINPDGSNEYDIFLVDSDIPAGYSGPFYPDKPLHEQPRELLQVLFSTKEIDELRKTYVGSKYSYMYYVGDRAIDLYKARKAPKWDILYMPNVYYMVEDRFQDIYKVNREIYANRSYQEFFAQSGEYYDQMMILIVLSETFANLITDVPEWYIRRDIFDIRSCQYFLESYGVTFFKIIPLKYQIRIVKNLNKLIKYKSSNQNTQDIIDIFDADIEIYRYWLYKKWNANKKEYELEFVASGLDESYDSYIKDSNNRTPYDDITLQDKYWDGEDSHAYVKQQILDQDFTLRGTKYMSVEYHVSMKEFEYQMNFMLGTILDSDNNLDDIKIPIPSLDQTSNFKLSNLFLFLVVLSGAYFTQGTSKNMTDVRFPEDESEGSKPTIDEDHYDWKVKYFPEIFVKKNGRILGFNNNLDKDKLRDELRKRHSHFRFGMRPMEEEVNYVGQEYIDIADEGINDDLNLDKFIVGGTFTTIQELMDYYNNNTECYKTLEKTRIEERDDNERKTLDYVFQEMYTKKYDSEFCRLSTGEFATDLIDVLKDRDYILYNIYLSAVSEATIDSRQDLIRSAMNDVVDTLEYYFYGQNVDYLFSFTTIASFSAIVQYIYLMIGFFKSYKVYFLDPYSTYKIDDNVENSAKCYDVIAENRFDDLKTDSLQVQDVISGYNETQELYDWGLDPDINIDAVDIHAHDELDPLNDYDYDGHGADVVTFDIDLDGSYEYDVEGVKFIVAEAGTAGRALDFYNINGGDAYEYPHIDYYELDGSYADELEDPFQSSDSGKDYLDPDYEAGEGGTVIYIDSGEHNFGDIDLGDETAKGDYNFQDLDEPEPIGKKDPVQDETNLDFDTLATYSSDTNYGDFTRYGLFTTYIDGASADGRWFATSSLTTYLRGTELLSDIIIADRYYNGINIDDEGIYLLDSWIIDNKTMKTVVTSMQLLMNQFRATAGAISADMEVLTDLNALDARIEGIADYYSYNFEYVANELIKEDKFINDNKKAVDDMLYIYDDLKDKLDPYEWVDLD